MTSFLLPEKQAPAISGFAGTSGNTRFAGVNLVASTSLNVEFMATIFGIFEQVRMGCCATNPYATYCFPSLCPVLLTLAPADTTASRTFLHIPYAAGVLGNLYI